MDPAPTTLRLVPPVAPVLKAPALDIDVGTTLETPSNLAARRETTHNSGVGAETAWFERVATYVRVAARVIPGVTAAFVSKDGRQVTITGPTWTPELSRAGAVLVTAILRELRPDAAHWIRGGFSERYDELPPDCEWVLPP
jgi:hypothetical protein